MQEFLLFVEAYQAWIYLFLVLVALLNIRLFVGAITRYRGALYTLERERALNQTLRSGAVLAVLSAGFIAIFILTTFAVPAIPAALRPTPIPTVSLLATAVVEGGASDTAFATSTPFSVDLVDSAGCANPNATISEPLNNDTLQGQIEFRGVANVPGFAFYKLEYHDLQPDSTWLAISASNIAVCEQLCDEEEKLGTWDTSLVRPGQYAVQLVVTDTLGNAPLPCQILIQVLP